MITVMRSLLSRSIRRPAVVLFCLCLNFLLVFPGAAPADAKSYSADRFDAVIKLLDDGSIDVTETVVFRFEDGTFREVFREIPQRRTDGIEVIHAEMQGQRLPFGNEPGTVEVRHRNSTVRVVWRFRAVEGLAREFVLNYRVHGVVRHDVAGDLLNWRATPGEHRYRIGSSTIRFELPQRPAEAPRVTTRKTDPPQVAIEENVVRITTSAIGQNGWVEAALRFPRGAVIDAPPAWQQHAAQVAAQSTRWIAGAAGVVLAGLMLLIAWRQSYDAPVREPAPSGSTIGPMAPDSLPPAVAGVLSTNGRTGLEHLMATLFSLAERSEVDIQEMPRGTLRQRAFVVERRRGAAGLTGYEAAALDTIFKGSAAEGSSVTLSQARSRASLRPGTFARAMERELLSAGFLDESRKALRRRYHLAAVWLLAIALACVVPAVFLTSEYGGWPFLIPATILLLALCSVFFAASITPLSNEGVRRGHRWRAYGKHLSAVAASQQPASGTPVSTVLPYAVALGLATAWAKFLKQHAHTVPPWFHALQSTDDAAFAGFVAAGGANASGGGGGGTGGAAGGGGSGAG
jgi:hypothetical protein